jgi:two-component system, chemotaxis family, sensor kinase CheA
MEQAEAAELRLEVEQLAVRLVMADTPTDPGEAVQWLAGVHRTLDGMAERAGAMGWEEAAETARGLGALAAEGALFEQAKAGLEEGLAELGAALERAARQEASRADASIVAPPPASPAPPSSAARPNGLAALAEDRELLGDFVLEARDHLTTIEGRLLEFEQGGGAAESIHSVFRAFHSIKGLAGFLELDDIREVAHEVETLLGLARDEALQITPEAVDVILESSDYLSQWVKAIEGKLAGTVLNPPGPYGALLDKVRTVMAGAAAAEPPRQAPSQASGAAEAPSCTAQPAPQTEPQPKAMEAAPAEAAADAEKEPSGAKRASGEGEFRAVKVHTAKLDYLVDMVGELVIAQSLVRHDPDLGLGNRPRLAHNISQLARITDEVQRTAMSMRMVPVGPLFQKMSRLVRDLSRKSAKQVELEVSGESTEIDRNIVEQLADPLMHMVRNSVDHGIETAEQRAASGKPAVAKVSLRARHESGHIVVEVADDGRGLDRTKILAKAVRNGLVGPDDSLSEQEIFALIFQPGFSTAEQITDVSGRGVGMDVVKRNVQKLRGRIEVRSEPGRGSTFQLKLPLTLAIIEGLVVGVAEERYIVPLFAVKEIVHVKDDTLATVENRYEMAQVRGELLPVLRLNERFNVGHPRGEQEKDRLLIVANTSQRRFCLMVDQLIGKQEVVIKGLGDTFKHVVGLAGAAILGDGRVGLILDVETLFAGGAGGGLR